MFNNPENQNDITRLLRHWLHRNFEVTEQLRSVQTLDISFKHVAIERIPWLDRDFASNHPIFGLSINWIVILINIITILGEEFDLYISDTTLG